MPPLTDRWGPVDRQSLPDLPHNDLITLSNDAEGLGQVDRISCQDASAFRVSCTSSPSSLTSCSLRAWSFR